MEFQKLWKKFKENCKMWLGRAREFWSGIRVRRTRGCTRVRLVRILICTPPARARRESLYPYNTYPSTYE